MPWGRYWCPVSRRPALAWPAPSWGQPHGRAPGWATRSPAVAGAVWDGLCQPSVGGQSEERTPWRAPASAWPTRRGPRERLRGRKSVGLAGARVVVGWPRLRAVGRASAGPLHAQPPLVPTPRANAGPSQSGQRQGLRAGVGSARLPGIPRERWAHDLRHPLEGGGHPGDTAQLGQRDGLVRTGEGGSGAERAGRGGPGRPAATPPPAVATPGYLRCGHPSAGAPRGRPRLAPPAVPAPPAAGRDGALGRSRG